MRYLTIDGMPSGTGIRDSLAGGYLDPEEVGLSLELVQRIQKWVIEYETAHYLQFKDEAENQRLDQEGVEITRQARDQFSESKSNTSRTRGCKKLRSNKTIEVVIACDKRKRLRKGAKRRSNPSIRYAARWIASLRSQ